VGIAVTLVLGLSAGLGALVGLPVPGVDAGSGRQSLAGAGLLGVDPGTPPGLTAGYVFPVAGPHDFGEAAARFGAERYGHTHEGQDVFATPGTPLVAVRDGIVLDGAGGKSFYAYGGGNSVVIYSPSVDRSFVYLHMLHPARVRAGDRVHAGQVIGQVGCTGSCDGPHLHFEVRIGRVAYGHEGRPIDPLPYLRQWQQPTPG
jgi:murein DD-endopeptidase MepM/ murein hydrolase activator NlpD